jgi:short-subunit dehydrogenase
VIGQPIVHVVAAVAAGTEMPLAPTAAVAPLPFQGFYSAAKAGILQLTKALSIEMRSFGVQCCCILPGDVKTGFTAARRVVAAAQDPASPYREMTARSLVQMEKDEQREGMPPSVIASAVLRQLRRKKMRPECVPGALYAFLVPVIRLLPERLVLRVIEKMYL